MNSLDDGEYSVDPLVWSVPIPLVHISTGYQFVSCLLTKIISGINPTPVIGVSSVPLPAYVPHLTRVVPAGI